MLTFYLKCISLATKITSISVEESIILGGNNQMFFLACELTLALSF